MLTFTKTTDGQHVGMTAHLDPRHLPTSIPLGNGVVFKPVWVREVTPRVWRIWNDHYTVIAKEH